MSSVPRPARTVGEVFRRYGDAFRAQVGTVLSTAQHRVMTAIEQCRTAALGGHVEQCDHCGHRRVWYNSCRNRHCPTYQSLARAEWLERRRADLLPTECFHVVFTVPPAVAEVAAQNKAVVYGLLFRTVAETLRTIAADPRHLGAEIGFFAVLHTWGQTLVHHPHLHCVIPGGGLANDGSGWVACRPGFFLPVRVLSRYFRRVLLAALEDAFESGQLHFAGRLQPLAHCLVLLQGTEVAFRVGGPLGGRLFEPEPSFYPILLHPTAVGIHDAEIRLRPRVSLAGCLEIPLDGFHVISLHPAAVGIHVAEIELRSGVPPAGCLEIPPGSFFVILLHPATAGIHDADVVLRARVSLRSRLAEPPHGFFFVLRYPVTVGVHDTEIPLRGRVTLVGRASVPLNSAIVVFRYAAAAVLIPPPKFCLCSNVPLVSTLLDLVEISQGEILLSRRVRKFWQQFWLVLYKWDLGHPRRCDGHHENDDDCSYNYGRERDPVRHALHFPEKYPDHGQREGTQRDRVAGCLDNSRDCGAQKANVCRRC